MSAQLIAAACGLLAATAHADDDEDLVRRGIELRRNGRDEEALALFERSYRAHPNPRARAQMALAEQSLGEWLAAEADLRVALSSDDAWVSRNREPLEESLRFVSTHLGWLNVSSNVPSARVQLGGAVAGTVPLPAPARVVAGEVLLRVEADGYAPKETTVRVGADEHADVYVLLSPAPPAAGSRAAPQPPAASSAHVPVAASVPSPSRPVPWAAFGAAAVGLAGIGVGAAFGVDVLIQKAARDQNCHGGQCNGTGLDRDAAARRSALVSDIGFAVGAAGLATCAWLLLRGTPPRQPIDVRASGSTSSFLVSAGRSW